MPRHWHHPAGLDRRASPPERSPTTRPRHHGCRGAPGTHAARFPHAAPRASRTAASSACPAGSPLCGHGQLPFPYQEDAASTPNVRCLAGRVDGDGDNDAFHVAAPAKGITPMTDEQGTSEGSPGFIQPWIAQLRKITEELAGMTGLSESVFARPAPSLPSVPLPGAISASQLSAIASAL